MRAWKLRSLIVLVPMICSACTQVEPIIVREEDPDRSETASEATADSKVSDSEAVADALRHALDGGWRTLRIFDECQTADGPRTVEIFGHGVAIWNRGRQFRLSEDEIRRGLEAFVTAGFAAMPAEFGGRVAPEPGVGRSGSGSGNATRVICQVVLELDGVRKRVAQLDIGEQSEALRRLAETLLEISREPAGSGLATADLADGLAKVAAGDLAPETFKILAHLKPRDQEGWLLRVEGTHASTHRFIPGEGYGDPSTLELAASEVVALASLMSEHDLAELPINLYAEHYTDLKVEVLDRRLSLQARRFAGMTPTQHGARQTSFEKVFEALTKLHQRLLNEGR